MKKTLSLLLATLLTLSIGLFSACQYEAPKSIIGAQLNDKGELILTYSDNTTQNLGIVKGEDGKNGIDGIDGVDLTSCQHQYDFGDMTLAPTCTSIGYDTRTCSLCGDVQYEFTKAIGHNYTNPVDIINTCEQHWVSKTCSVCGDTKLEEVDPTKHVFEGEWEIKEYPCATVKQRPCLYCDTKQTEIIETIDFGAHTFDENTLCTTCGHQEFIESEEYITSIPEWGGFTWMSVDGNYGLQIMTSYDGTFISGYVGTPVNVVIPSNVNETPIPAIGGNFGFGSLATPFASCKTLNTLILSKGVTLIRESALKDCTNLKHVTSFNSALSITQYAFWNCTSLKEFFYPQDTTYVNLNAFLGCTSLTTIYAPKNVKIIHKYTYEHEDAPGVEKIIFYE